MVVPFEAFHTKQVDWNHHQMYVSCCRICPPLLYYVVSSYRCFPSNFNRVDSQNPAPVGIVKTTVLNLQIFRYSLHQWVRWILSINGTIFKANCSELDSFRLPWTTGKWKANLKSSSASGQWLVDHSGTSMVAVAYCQMILYSVAFACRCASHKKHHEVKGKQLAGAFQSSSMALTDLDTLASTFRCFFTTHSTNIHKPPSALSNNHVETLASRDVWSFSGPFFSPRRRPCDFLTCRFWPVGKGWKAGVERCWLECLQSSKEYSTVYIIHHCMMQTQDQQAKQMEYTAWI